MAAQVENLLVLPAGVVDGVTSDDVVVGPFRISNLGIMSCRIDMVVGDVTQVGTLTLKLQHSSDGVNWEDTKSSTFTEAGVVTIKFLPQVAGDQAHLPLRPLGRIVASATDAGDAFTVEAAKLIQLRGI